MLIGYADDSTFMAVVTSPGVWVTLAESLIRNLSRVNEWCHRWAMKLNASKTKTKIVLRSSTMRPLSPTLIIDGTVLRESDDLVILGVTLDSKMIFEKHLRSIFKAAFLRLVSWGSHGEYSIIDRFFGDAFGVFSCPFWSTVLQCDARLPINTLKYNTLGLQICNHKLHICENFAHNFLQQSRTCSFLWTTNWGPSYTCVVYSAKKGTKHFLHEFYL